MGLQPGQARHPTERAPTTQSPASVSHARPHTYQPARGSARTVSQPIQGLRQIGSGWQAVRDGVRDSAWPLAG
jgi:hypothetical protein